MKITDKLKKTVLTTIKENNLLESGDRVLVGLSGGADSMCLLHVLCNLSEKLGIEIAAMHMNHNIRGSEADSDAMAAQSLADSLNIRFFLVSKQVKEYAKENSLSEELAGRELRYQSFSNIMKNYGYTKTATAHNRNDSAETILMNFMRGSGISGLCGIPVSRGNIIRPLINVSRAEIEEYCNENNLHYVTDSTNLTTAYTRNKIRLNLIPEIQAEFNPNFINTVTSNAEIISKENSYINGEALKAYKSMFCDNSLDTAMFNSLHPAIKRRVIINFMSEVYGSMTDISSVAVEDIMELCGKNKTGKSVDIPRGYKAVIEYGRLYIRKPRSDDRGYEYHLNIGERLEIPQLGTALTAELCDVKNDKNNKNVIYISCNDVSCLSVRSRKNGDVFFPLGMNGKKKLKDFFIDKKIPAEKRQVIPIITADGNIAAVYNLRCDRRYSFGVNKFNLKITINNI